MPQYDVRERHSVAVSAPAEITLSAAREVSFQDSRIARTIFALRALPGRLRGVPPAPTERRPVFEEVTALGWQELVEAPGTPGHHGRCDTALAAGGALPRPPRRSVRHVS
jgi:hypothetical protein